MIQPDVRTPALVCRDLGFRIRKRPILLAQNFAIQPGEFVALLGANGAGKTTLLRLIMGLLTPSEGSIDVWGRPAHAGKARNHVGYMPQSVDADNPVPLRVRDVVGFGCPVLGRRGWRLSRHDRRRIEDAMAQMDIHPLADRPVQSLSGGEARRMHLARVLCQQARLLLLDEPTAHLDLAARLDFFERIEALHSQHNMTVVLVMHDLNAMPRSCTRARVLNAGCAVYDGAFHPLLDPRFLSRLFRNQTPRTSENPAWISG